MDALDQTSDDNVAIVHSDNRGNPCVTYCDSNNWLLRGHKFYDFEGSLKFPAFVYDSKLDVRRRGSSYDGLMHHVDWIATLLALATSGQSSSSLATAKTDSINHWNAIVTGETSGDPYADRERSFSLRSEEATWSHRNFQLMTQDPTRPVTLPLARDYHV